MAQNTASLPAITVPQKAKLSKKQPRPNLFWCNVKDCGKNFEHKGTMNRHFKQVHPDLEVDYTTNPKETKRPHVEEQKLEAPGVLVLLRQDIEFLRNANIQLLLRIESLEAKEVQREYAQPIDLLLYRKLLEESEKNSPARSECTAVSSTKKVDVL